jgi:phosphoglycolate phosphatase
MIGDTTYDIEMGRAAGFTDRRRVLGLSPWSGLRDAGADVVVDDFAALRSILAEGLPTP